MKSWIEGAVVVAAGALIGTFLGKCLALTIPQGRVHDLFATQLAPVGLHPTTLDLRIVEVTVGCLFRFNVMSIAGIVIAAVLYKRVWR